MNVNINDILTLDNDMEYIVCSKIDYNNDDYLYLININNNLDFKILKYNKNTETLIEVNSEKIQVLLPLFYKVGIKNFNDLINSFSKDS
ncbi:MAG: hypothetical protein IJO32_04645 [Bacilli bacterium]|nr:hypothetical protein [Bacilli bacterium]